RCQSASVPGLYARASSSSRILPLSLPLYWSRSLRVLMLTRITSPSTGPFVPGVHAFGSAYSGAVRGASISTLDSLNSQPRPKSSKASSCTLARPQPLNFSWVQALAWAICGELVRRGPMSSVRWPRMTISRSTGSWAMAMLLKPRHNTHMQRLITIYPEWLGARIFESSAPPDRIHGSMVMVRPATRRQRAPSIRYHDGPVPAASAPRARRLDPPHGAAPHVVCTPRNHPPR